jgi:hypothetical protein
MLDPSPQLSMECFCQVVITVAILMHRHNLFVRCPSGDAMQNVRGGLIQGGYQMCGLVAGSPAVVFRHGLNLLNLGVCAMPAPVPVL